MYFNRMQLMITILYEISKCLIPIAPKNLQSTNQKYSSDSNLLRSRYLHLRHLKDRQRDDHSVHHNIRYRVANEEFVLVQAGTLFHERLPGFVYGRALEDGCEDDAYPP